ncbi:MAG: hypothetical protein HUJ58_08280, partial [Erysipelotrichaceae bacterium]|nr:hypothetical protein [Erysipelotrichaceae bacterium]
ALQMLTFPLLAITSKTMIYDAAPAELKSSGMQFATSVYSTGSALISPLLCGYLLDTFGANASLFGFMAVIIIPLVLCVTYMKAYKN